MTNVVVSCIQKPCSETQAISYSEIRLAALAIDPIAFGSNYSREAAFSLSMWIEKLSRKGNTTFYAHLQESSNTANTNPSHEIADSVRARWIGILTVLSPTFITSFPPPNNPPYPIGVSKAENKGADVWMLVGMWVRPECRKRGVGKLLVQSAIDEVLNTSNEAALAETSRNSHRGSQSDIIDVLTEVWGDSKEGTEVEVEDLNSERTTDGIILLLVNTNNAAAVKLYSSVGFKSFPGDKLEHTEITGEDFGNNQGGNSALDSKSSRDLRWMEYRVARKKHSQAVQIS
ncbi:hypothetical protein CPB83DRAFT_402836 [Crepidotus variabilis]|uniref:N-acetyltransferase domain-containing protein n=1 Tax=Crepidotus variabilis TaxID=179855 RepID=A0A9P6EE18_9AGAR|nr:hypothetical protein CPB83DRAFT_402836 [Crepidotus variabilis]